MSGGWAGSARRSRLPKDWSARRLAVLDRDGWRCTKLGCSEPATDVDHVDRHGGDEEDNLASLCGFHHSRKSSREGNAARWSRDSRRRPSEIHPGLN